MLEFTDELINIRFAVSPNRAQIEAATALLNPKHYKIAMQRAIRLTLTTGRAQMARIVAKTLDMRVTDIKDNIVTKAPSFEKLEGSFIADRHPVNLAYFNPKTTGEKMVALGRTRRGRGTVRQVRMAAGVSVKPWKDQPAQLLRSTFKMTRGRSPVYERELSGGPGSKRAPRFPLQMRYGPNVITAIAGNKRHEGDEEEINIDLSDTLTKNVDSQLQRVLENPQSLAKFV